MDDRLLARFCEKTSGLRIYGIVVCRNGEKIAEHHWEPEKRRPQYSGSKSFTSAAVGMAVGEKLFSPDDFVLGYLREDAPEDPCEFLRRLRIRDLLTMAVGQRQPHLLGDSRYEVEDKNWVRYALSRPFACEPGTRFMYSNVGPYLAGVIIQRLTGQTLVDYLMPRLFGPLGIARPEWESDPLGHTFGAAGLAVTVSELAQFGLLYLRKGEWNGRRLIPADWVEASGQKQIETAGYAEDLADNRFGYGYLFWRGRHDSYRADGVYGQYCIVLPDKDAVVAINANEPNRQGVLDAVWDDIHPLL
jgi:CubicO group peptidase (beta-lactamase class C family)